MYGRKRCRVTRNRWAWLVAGLLLWAGPAGGAEHVIHISVDGLNAGFLTDLLANDVAGDYANFQRFIDEGATTLNARTDYTHTNTLPNHTSMLTGRPVSQPTGQPNTVHHGYTSNSTPGGSDTLHNQGNPNVSYIASTFDVAKDAGLSTALYASKSKFIIFDQSYDGTNGGAGPFGMDKIDTYFYAASGSPSNASTMQAAYLADMAVSHYDYSFVHYRDPDSAGHASGWGGSAWDTSVANVDDYLGAVLSLVEGDAALNGRTTVIVTADHGGTGTGHGTASNSSNYTIPMLVWGAGVTAGVDLYALNTGLRTDPGTGRPDYNASGQPIRNGDGGNLALRQLGLGAVPGSSINSGQDLLIRLPGDVNGDGLVDVADLALVGGQWNTPGGAPSADLNFDHTVDIGDMAIVGNNWGSTVGGTSLDEAGGLVPSPSALFGGWVMMAVLGRRRAGGLRR